MLEADIELPLLQTSFATDAVVLTTAHSAKGLEFDVVFMIGLDQGIIPFYSETSKEAKREPRRLYFKSK